MNNSIDSFVDLIRSQFSERERNEIHEHTNMKLLKEWSSLQTMIVVSEIDKEFGVVLDFQDLKSADTVAQLYNIVLSKKS